VTDRSRAVKVSAHTKAGRGSWSLPVQGMTLASGERHTQILRQTDTHIQCESKKIPPPYGFLNFFQ